MKARVELALRNRYATLCEYLLTWAETDERDRSHGPEWVTQLVAQLDRLDAHLADSGPLVKRVTEAVEKAKQSIPKHSRNTEEKP